MFFPVMLIKACSTLLLFLYIYIYIYIFFTRKKFWRGLLVVNWLKNSSCIIFHQNKSKFQINLKVRELFESGRRIDWLAKDFKKN